MTTDTLDTKLKALEAQETQVLASLRQNQSQAQELDNQRRNLEQQQIAIFGAKSILNELKNELSEVQNAAPEGQVLPINS